MKKIILVLLLLAVPAVGFYFFAQEKKDLAQDSTSTTSAIAKAQIEEQQVHSQGESELNFAGTLVEHLPAESFGFIYVDFVKESYQKLANSVWRLDLIGKLLNSQSTKNHNHNLSNVLRIVEKMDLKVFKEELKGIAIYLSSDKTKGQPIDAGLIFDVKNPEYLEKLLTVVREELKTESVQVTEVDFKEKGSGLKIERIHSPSPPSGSAEEQTTAQQTALYFVKNANFAALAATEENVIALLDQQITRPQILDSERFKIASRELSPNDQITALAYFDLQQIVQANQANLAAALVEHSDLLNLGNLSSIIYASSFLDVPSYFFRLNVENEWTELFSKLQNSDFTELYSMVSNDVVMAFAMDGSILKTLYALLEQNKAVNTNQANLQLVTSIDKILFTERAAPLGQSILPVPDLLFAVKSSNIEQILAQTKSAIQQLMNSSGGGAAGTTWSEKDIAGVKVEYLLSPIGIGAFLASKDAYLLIASNETQIKEALTGYINNSKDFISSLESNSDAQKFSEGNLSTFYLNYPQLSAQLESLKGLLSAFSGEAGPDILSQENLGLMKQKRRFVSNLQIGKKDLSYRAGYQL